jgi:hypothetical protein
LRITRLTRDPAIAASAQDDAPAVNMPHPA